jgi:hypothetical protein
MITWEQYIAGEDANAFGEFLVSTIAELYGAKPRPESVDRAVYKATDCGAWVRFDAEGIKVGTIVEGSDATYDERIDLDGIDLDDAGAATLVARFRAAIANCEAFAAEHFGKGAGDEYV